MAGPVGNSPCIEHLSGNDYRCRNLGMKIRATRLPIHCSCGGPTRSMDDLEQAVAEHAQRPLAERDVERLDICAGCGQLWKFNHCLQLDTDGCGGSRFLAYAIRLLADDPGCELWSC